MQKLILLSIAVIPSLFLLTGCGEKEQTQIKESFNQEFRASFITEGSKKCVETVSQNSKIPAPIIQEICDCTANELVDKVSVEDLPNIISGNLNEELSSKISSATMLCIQKTQTQKATASEAKK